MVRKKKRKSTTVNLNRSQLTATKSELQQVEESTEIKANSNAYFRVEKQKMDFACYRLVGKEMTRIIQRRIRHRRRKIETKITLEERH